MNLYRFLGTALSTFCWLFPLAAEAGQPALFNAEGYRQAHYRSPTPATVAGARTLNTAQLQQLLAQTPHTQLIDVYRRQWLHGQFINDQPHHNLPGSLWLANTGDGTLHTPWLEYLSQYLQQISHGQSHWPIVFYCRSDCWLGWNAVKRAHSLGYRNLYWYRDGTDAWQEAGLPVQEAQPAALHPTSAQYNNH